MMRQDHGLPGHFKIGDFFYQGIDGNHWEDPVTFIIQPFDAASVLKGYENRGLTLILAAILPAQDPNPLSADAKRAYEEVKTNILRSAEKMPEASYDFRPAPRVRTFGQILGHIAQEQYLYFCGPAKGEQKSADIERTRTTKADLPAALQESFSYCDAVYA
jgi:hypothetical protein